MCVFASLRSLAAYPSGEFAVYKRDENGVTQEILTYTT